MRIVQRFNAIIGYIRMHGVRSIAQRLRQRVVLRMLAREFGGLRGLEIGGPSSIFKRRGLIPIYSAVSGLDNCNFHSSTVWEGKIAGGYTFNFRDGQEAGRQYLCEATELDEINADVYDFVAASHVLEHVANPIKALHEWRRVLRPDGKLLLVLPHRDGTFDHRRPITSIEHMVSDYERNVSESDETHIAEMLELHDLKRDAGVADHAELIMRCQANAKNRCVHHHVFNTRSAMSLLTKTGFSVERIEPVLPFHIVLFAQKISLNARRGADVDCACRRSPFQSDRI